jgi:hypothetical protein
VVASRLPWKALEAAWKPCLAKLQKCPPSRPTKTLEIPAAQRLSGLQGLGRAGRVELPVNWFKYPQIVPAKAQFP